MTSGDADNTTERDAVGLSQGISDARRKLEQLRVAIQRYNGTGSNSDDLLATITETVEVLSLGSLPALNTERPALPMELLAKILKEFDQRHLLAMRLVNSSWNKAIMYVLRNMKTPALSPVGYRKLMDYVYKTGGLNSLSIKFNPEDEFVLLQELRKETFKLRELDLSLYYVSNGGAFEAIKSWGRSFHFEGLEKLSMKLYVRNTGLGIDGILSRLEGIESFKLEVIDFIGDYPTQLMAEQMVLPLKELTLKMDHPRPHVRGNAQCRMFMETVAKHKFTALKSLELDGCEVHSSMLRELLVPTLKRLTIQHMQRTCLSEVLQALSANDVRLDYFRYSCNSTWPDEDLLDTDLSPLSELRELDLCSTTVTNTGLANLLQVAPGLQAIRLQNNYRIGFGSGNGPGSALSFENMLEWCTNIEELELQKMELTGVELDWICCAVEVQQKGTLRRRQQQQQQQQRHLWYQQQEEGRCTDRRLRMLDIRGNRYSDLSLQRFLRHCGLHLRVLKADAQYPAETRLLAVNSGVCQRFIANYDEQ